MSKLQAGNSELATRPAGAALATTRVSVLDRNEGIDAVFNAIESENIADSHEGNAAAFAAVRY